MEWLSGFLDQIIGFYQFIWDFFSKGIYDFSKEVFVILTQVLVYSWFKMQIFSLEVAYEAAQGIVSDLGVTAAVRSYYAGLPAEVASIMSFFGIPQCLNIIFSALTTRFVLRFVPLGGR